MKHLFILCLTISVILIACNKKNDAANSDQVPALKGMKIKWSGSNDSFYYKFSYDVNNILSRMEIIISDQGINKNYIVDISRNTSGLLTGYVVSVPGSGSYPVRIGREANGNYKYAVDFYDDSTVYLYNGSKISDAVIYSISNLNGLYEPIYKNVYTYDAGAML